MAYIPNEIIEQVKQRADIVEVLSSYMTLNSKGTDFWGCCPFHKEKTPSFKVNPALQNYYCFGCSKSGNIFTFIQERENVDFVGAVKILLDRYHIKYEEKLYGNKEEQQIYKQKDEVLQSLEIAAKWYKNCLNLPEAQIAREYLSKRGVDAHWIEEFSIGYSPESNSQNALQVIANKQNIPKNILETAGLISPKEGTNPPQYYERFRGRLMFPISNEFGHVVGFSARYLGTETNVAKYINSTETIVFKKNRILYALNKARVNFKEKGYALICEGQLDVIACHRAGLNNAVCSQGTAFTEQHAQLIRRYIDKVIFCFDADKAGIKATIRSLQIAIEANLNCKIATLPDGEDPDSLLKKSGTEALRVIIDNAQDCFEYLYDYGCQQYDQSTPNGKNDIAKLIIPIIELCQSPITLSAQLQWLAKKLELPIESINSAFNQLAKKNNSFNKKEKHIYQNNNQSMRITGALDFSTKSNQESISISNIVPKIDNNVASKAEIILLDIALYSIETANIIVENLNHNWLGKDNNVAIALHYVLTETQFGSWDKVKEHLVLESDLIQDKDVGRILMDSEFLPPQQVGKEGEDIAISNNQDYFNNVILLALNDCLAALESKYIEQRLKEIKLLFQDTNISQDKINEIMLENQQLNQRKRLLKQR